MIRYTILQLYLAQKTAAALSGTMYATHARGQGPLLLVTEPSNYDGPHVSIIVIMTSDNHTYVPHNLKGLLFSEQDPITRVLQY
jgi:hypothetical protein